MLRKRWLGLRSSVKKIRRLSRATKIRNVFHFALPDIITFRKKALQRYKEVKRKSALYAQRFHQQLIRARAQKFRTTEDTQANLLRRTTYQRTTARRIRELTGAPRTSLNILDSPTPSGDRQLCQNKLEVEQACFAEGQRRFTQAYDTPFVNEPLLPLIGLLGLGPAVPSILDGTFTPPPAIDEYTKKFLSHLAMPECIRQQPPLSFGISTADHIQGWKKMKSKISSSPFGPSFADYIAGSEDSLIAATDATFATIPAATGYCPLAWAKAMDVMIPKKADSTLVEKLRIIILFHALYNMINKRMGREMVTQAEKFHLIPQEAYGSRRNCRSIECGLNKVLTADISRQRRSPLALCSNDAISCYDRIIHSVASLSMQRLGVAPESCRLLFGTLEQVQHFVRTTYGDSASHYGGIRLRPLQGIGQGNGAGPAIWLIITIPLINMLREAGFGFRSLSAISGETGYFVCYTFVDDTDLVHSNPVSTQLIPELQQMLNIWEGGLHATGGALSAEKSYWYAFEFAWTGKTWRYTTIDELPGTLTILLPDRLHSEPLLRLEPSEARETLGLWIAPDGNQTAQFTALVDKATHWASKIRSGRLNFAECWISLTTGILKTLEYPLMATSLSRPQCKAILKPILAAALPSIHIATTLPLVVRHGPLLAQGLAIPDLWVLQGIHKIWAYLRHGDQTTITGQLLRASYEQATLEVGINQLLQSNYKRFGHLITKTHLSALWMFLDHVNLHLRHPQLLLPLKCVGDRLIMEYFGAHPEVSRSSLLSINLCRQWLKVLTLSDMTSGDGKSILLSIWMGLPSTSTAMSPLNWPDKVERPATHHWTIWRRALSLLCTGTTRTLRLPLGAWTIPAPAHEWFYDTNADRLYSYQPQEKNYKIYSRLPQRRLRRTRYQCTTVEPLSHLPASAARTVVIQVNPYIVSHTGTRPTILPASVDPVHCTDWSTRCLHLPSDISPILEGLRTGTAVAICDGSYKDNIGTAAFCIQSDLSGQHRILGCNLTPGHPDHMTPYRSELGGIYGVVRQVHRIVQTYHLTSGSIILACDCLSALKSVFEAPSESPSQSDFDLLHDIRAFIQSSPITWKWKHIYGHQDQHQLFSTLDRYAQVNVQMDFLAKKYWSAQVSRYQPYYPVSPFAWSLWFDDIRYSQWDKDRIYTDIMSPSLQQHWRQRRSIPSSTSIAWSPACAALKQGPLFRRLMIPKWLAGFMPTGVVLHRRGLQSSDACPRCGLPETTSHVILCSAPSAIVRWQVNLRNYSSWLRSRQTMPDIARIILYHLQCWHDHTEPASFTPSCPSIAAALLDQTSIGWGGLLEGFVSMHWQLAQAEHFARIGSHQSARRWIIAVIRKGWDISWDMWDHRCSVRNLPLLSFAQIEENHILDCAIRREFTTGISDWRPVDQRWFRRTYPQIQTEDISYKRLWLSHVETIRGRNLRRISPSVDRQRACFRRFFTGP